MSNSNFNRFAEFPRNHVTITPNNSTDLAREMLILCGTTGTIAVHDSNGTAITYTIDTPNSILPIICKRVLATGTTVTQVIGLY